MDINEICVKETVEEYLDKADWRVNANANQGFSLGGLILNGSGKLSANYWLNNVYNAKVGEAHRNGDLHIHDLDLLGAYCCGHSLRALLHEGLNGVPGKTASKPAKHLDSALQQMINFLGTMQNEWAGAQAFSSFDTYLAPYIRVDNLDGTRIRQLLQEFIFSCNNTTRWGNQTVFSNITLDLVCPKDIAEKDVLIGGKVWEYINDKGEKATYKYGDFQKEMDTINILLPLVMSEGDADGRPFTFPIPTYNVTNDFPWDSPAMDNVFEMTAKYGLPYFSNYISSDMSPSDVRSMCCRLRLNTTEIRKRGNGLFGSAEQTGSIGVVTINLARLGYLYKGNREELFNRLAELCDMAKDSLVEKRAFLNKQLKNRLYPFTKRWLGTYRNFFNTIGVNGGNEMVRNFFNDKEDITTKEGLKLASDILDFINDKLIEYQKETNTMFNLEATPAEGTTYRFAKEDQKRYKDIIQAGCKKSPYYTNSTQLPVNFTDDIITALDLQEGLQTKYTGGTVLHLYMGEKLPSGKVCKELVKRVLTNYKIPYVSITPTFSICPTHGYISGEHEFCPLCDEDLLATKIKENTIDQQ